MNLWRRIRRQLVGPKGRHVDFAHNRDTAFALETLEPRVLLSGDMVAAVIPPPPSQQSVSVAQLLTMDASAFAATAEPSTVVTPEPQASTPPSLDTPSRNNNQETSSSLPVNSANSVSDENSPSPTGGDTTTPTLPGESDVPSSSAPTIGTTQSSSRTYFISSTGNDANDGSSTTQALQSLARVSALNLMPGDIVALEGGASFSGTLTIHNSGLAVSPIQVTSYTTVAGDRAEILAGHGDGVVVKNAEHVVITNLKVTGAGADVNNGQGIMILHDDSNDQRLQDVQIDKVEASGFRYAGIAMYTGGNLRYGYQDVRITHADVHDNGYAGMWTGSAPGNYPDHPETYAYQNVYVGYSTFHDNQGLAINQQTGNGIFLKDVDGGVIEHCQAYNNGALNQSTNGPVGMWAIYSNNIVIQFNESFGNRTQGGDGGGFDLDGGTTNSVMQYNYSHDNAGPGYLVYQFNDVYRAQSSGNVVRYNISENDVRRGEPSGAIDIRAQNSPEVNTQIYGNTVYLDNGGLNSINVSAIRTSGNLSHVRIFNNFLITSGGVRLVDTEGNLEAALFQGNHYSTDGNPFVISSGGVLYGSVDAWRTVTNQERGGSPRML